jgi:transcriptional antiterminator RfaH
MNELTPSPVKPASVRDGACHVTSFTVTDRVSDSAQWYVIHTKPKQEFRALEQLENQDYQCFLPTITREKICRRRLVSVTESLFSRYLFIRLDTVTSNWSPIRSTRGVSGLVAFGTRFATLDDSLIEALQQRNHDCTAVHFTPGETVEITAGPFAGLEGLYQMPDGEARALVLIEMMNQPQKLCFPIASLCKTS